MVERGSRDATVPRFMVDLLVVPVSARLRPAGYDADHTTWGSGRNPGGVSPGFPRVSRAIWGLGDWGHVGPGSN